MIRRLSIFLLSIGLITLGNTFISAQYSENLQKESIHKGEHIHQEKSLFIKQRAEEMGINTEGKETEAILKEIKTEYINMHANL